MVENAKVQNEDAEKTKKLKRNFAHLHLGIGWHGLLHI